MCNPAMKDEPPDHHIVAMRNPVMKDEPPHHPLVAMRKNPYYVQNSKYWRLEAHAGCQVDKRAQRA